MYAYAVDRLQKRYPDSPERPSGASMPAASRIAKRPSTGWRSIQGSSLPCVRCTSFQQTVNRIFMGWYFAGNVRLAENAD